MSGEGVYYGAIRVLSLLMVGLGVVILAVTLTSGGGVLSLGVLMGLAFVGVGAGRLYMASRMRP